ncbi:Endonuclease/exonuclease/phosphatase [Fennellomyces sp. T-0311]|nr:Endonuclease/exonuclease/phosphatase [Fennellomyces sp. T-0311]
MIASVNCNGLTKTSNPSTRSQFIQYLRTIKAHIITMQETHASPNNNTETILHQQFMAHQSFWTPHCGIVSLSSDLHITQLNLFHTDRVICVCVEHLQNDLPPFFILTIYAPSHSPTQRRHFYEQLLQSALFDPQQHYLDRLVITGDFNYSYQ